jgi:type IV secretion system protein VirB6
MLLITTFVLNRDGWLDMAVAAIQGLKDGVSGDDNIWALLDTVWERHRRWGKSYLIWTHQLTSN